MKVFIFPALPVTADTAGDGGIRRVGEGMVRHLPDFGIEIVDRSEDAELVACHAIIPESIWKMFKGPIVELCHGLYWSEYEWLDWAVKTNKEVMESIRIADAITAPSEWVAHAIRRAACRPVTVISHGIDADDWATDGGHDSYVLWDKGRPDPICDPQPVADLATKMPTTQFVATFAGDHPQNLRVTGKLAFDEAKRLVQRAEVYLATTRGTFEIGVLQALAAGVPVVGWKWGGPAEYLVHGEEAWLCKPGDIDGLVEGIIWARKNREAIRPKAIARARQFPWEKAAEQYAGLFEATLANWQMLHDKKRPRTSVIVPAHNLERFITDTLESVLLQDESGDRDWECVVVDDASPDNTAALVETWVEKDPRFRLVRNETNVYLAEARNVGIRAAKGRYILPLDADDMLGPNTIKILADALDADRSIHITYGGCYFVEEDGRTPINYPNELAAGYSGWPLPYFHQYQVGPNTRGQLLPYSSMFRRQVAELTGGYRRRWRSSEDCDFWTRAGEYGFRPKMVTTAPMLVYRDRPDSMSKMTGWHDREVKQWFTGHRGHSPAGAATDEQLPVPSYQPVISVVIPCGPGHGRYVLDAIDSVAAQTFENWEVIVVMNGVEDPPWRFPTWVRVVRKKDAIGVAAARNIGIAMARGRLFLPLDADDLLEPMALELMLEAHLPKGDIVYSDWWSYKGRGETGERVYEQHLTEDYDARLLTSQGSLHAVTALTPVDVWKAVGGYDEKVYGWEDWDFQLACAEKGFCSRRLAVPLLVYRMNLGRRREENIGVFDRSRADIEKKYAEYWDGGKKLMSCGCGGGAASTAHYGNGTSGAAAEPPTDAPASLVVYDGPREGSFTVKGSVTGRVYAFGRGEPKYVYEADIPRILILPNFDRVNGTLTPRPDMDSPVLVTDG